MQSARVLALVEAIAADGLSATPSGGSFTFTRPLWIGRGIPDAWVVPGQTIGVGNGHTSVADRPGARSTYGVSLAVTRPAAQRLVTVTLSGTLPAGPVL